MTKRNSAGLLIGIDRRSDRSDERQGIELLVVGTMIIFAAPPSQVEPGHTIHPDRRISITNFKVESVCAACASIVDELAKQRAADPASLPGRRDRQKQKLGFVGNYTLQ